MKAFISYSHRDENYVERLNVHLAQMKRENLIDEWTDKEIKAGNNLDTVISDALVSSELFLALLSPDYINSNYCYNKEFETAQKMQEEGKLMIVPIIVEPCDWQNTPFGKLKAVPKDGKAVSEWTNQNLAFLNVTDELRRLSKSNQSITESNIARNNEPLQTQRNYKVKKYFSEVDKVNFREESFETIKSYFKSSVEELNSVENLQARFTNDEKGFFTCLISNRANNQDAFLTIYSVKEGQWHFGDLNYSFSEQVNPNSMQMQNVFKIEDDEYNQYWTRNHQGFGYSNQSEVRLTAHQVAEDIWNDFISQVGVSFE